MLLAESGQYFHPCKPISQKGFYFRKLNFAMDNCVTQNAAELGEIIMRKKEVIELLNLVGMPHMAEIVTEYAEPCLGFETIPVQEQRFRLDHPRSEGIPTYHWPSHGQHAMALTSIYSLQLDLSEIHQCFEDELLPKSGWLYFFYDTESFAWGFDPGDKGKWRVLFFQGDLDSLVRTQNPGDSPKEYKSCRLTFYEALPPDWHFIRYRPELESEFDELDRFDHFVKALPGNSGHQVLGDPEGIQSSSEEMKLKCQLVSNGIYMGGSGGPPFDAAKAEELAPGAEDWRLLLQLDSDPHAGMLWGDVGRLYFWIREEDLRNRNFDHVWMLLECY